MPELKIVVAKNLTGKGHEQRQRAFLDHLRNEAEIKEIYQVGSGRPPGRDLPPDTKLDREYQGLTWKYGKGGVDLVHAASQVLKLPALCRSEAAFADFLRDYQPAGIWSDFEFVACRGARRYKNQMLPGDELVFTQRVDHHSAFLSKHVPRPRFQLQNVPTDLFLKTLCPADRYEGFHFKRYEPGRSDLEIHTPIIQPEIRERARQGLITRGRHILGYLPGYELETIVSLIKPHTHLPWIVYHHDVADVQEPLPHLTLKPVGFNDGYLSDLTSCFGAVVTTGFQLPSELLYMRKFFVGIIQRGQPEQSYNAAALRDIGVPVFKRLTPDTMSRTNHMLRFESDRLADVCAEDMDQVYPDNAKDIVQSFVRRCLENRRRARMSSVPRLSEESFGGSQIGIAQEKGFESINGSKSLGVYKDA